MPLKPLKARVALRRWLHHRSSSEYRELLDDERPSVGGSPKFATSSAAASRRNWSTVPGLIVDYDDSMWSLEDQDDQSKQPLGVRPIDEECTETSKAESPLSKQRLDADDIFIVGSASQTEAATSPRRLHASQSFETLETEEESENDNDESPRSHHRTSSPQGKKVEWADRMGHSLEVLHEIMRLPPLNVRVVILMLHPGEKVFEFVQCEYETDDRISVRDILHQLPYLASMDALSQQEYSHLYHRADRELMSDVDVQEYDIGEGEILVAIPCGYDPQHTMAAAHALLLQRSLLRAVQKAKLSGRALQKLLSSRQLAQHLAREKSEDSLSQLRPPSPLPVDAPGESSSPVETRDSVEEEDEDELRNSNRLVLRVLSKELGQPASDLNSTQRSPSTEPAKDARESLDEPLPGEYDVEEVLEKEIPEVQEQLSIPSSISGATTSSEDEVLTVDRDGAFPRLLSSCSSGSTRLDVDSADLVDSDLYEDAMQEVPSNEDETERTTNIGHGNDSNLDEVQLDVALVLDAAQNAFLASQPSLSFDTARSNSEGESQLLTPPISPQEPSGSTSLSFDDGISLGDLPDLGSIEEPTAPGAAWEAAFRATLLRVGAVLAIRKQQTTDSSLGIPEVTEDEEELNMI